MLDVSFAGVLTTEAVEATFDALAAVHDCGLLNGDIGCPNFLVDNRAHQGVRLTDFGFSRPITSSEDRKRACAIGSHVGTCAETRRAYSEGGHCFGPCILNIDMCRMLLGRT